MINFDSARGKLVQRARVPLGFLCAALTLFFARPSIRSLIAGALVATIGLALRAWAAGHIRKNSEVTVSGPYAYTRNPLYLGSLLLGVGFLIAAAQPLLVLLFAVLFFGIYLPVMRVEAEALQAKFGESFKRYAASVPLILPRLTPYRESVKRAAFDASLYLRYREYNAALGLCSALAVLVAKMYLWH